MHPNLIQIWSRFNPEIDQNEFWRKGCQKGAETSELQTQIWSRKQLKMGSKFNEKILASKQVMFMPRYLKTYVEIMYKSCVFSTFPEGRILWKKRCFTAGFQCFLTIRESTKQSKHKNNTCNLCVQKCDT